MKPITTNFDVDSELSIQMHRVSPGGSVNSSRRKPPPRLGGSVSRSRALDPTAGSVHRSHPGVSPRPGGTASRSEKSLGKIGRGSRKNHTPSGRCLNFDSIVAAPMNKPIRNIRCWMGGGTDRQRRQDARRSVRARPSNSAPDVASG